MHNVMQKKIKGTTQKKLHIYEKGEREREWETVGKREREAGEGLDTMLSKSAEPYNVESEVSLKLHPLKTLAFVGF